MLSLVYSSRSASTSSLVTAQQAGVQCMRQRFMCAAALTTSQLALRPGGAGGGVRWGQRSLGLPWPGTWQPAPLSRTCTCLSQHIQRTRCPQRAHSRCPAPGPPASQGLQALEHFVPCAGHCWRGWAAAQPPPARYMRSPFSAAAARASGPAATDQLLRSDRGCSALWTYGPWLEV